MNLPNKLTLLRIVLVPVCMALMLTGHFYIALGVFIVASITDFLDGYIARKNNLVTSFGKIMDPLADKILVFGALLCFLQLGFINSWCVAIILAREFFVTGMRVVAVDKGKVIAASWWGKVKTNVQMFAVMFGFLAFSQDSAALILAGQIAIYIATAFTAASWVAYIFENIEVFKD
ncbi:MAG: CDP-diacylglycerol--glycerol-3-phosphate 3-phosphatidyltransferase [Clostridia bacterium]|nr:CDP-diacylglycerol--glycerol-3-phosphate 3-phosphatidyltransferase [Clostridia bacterium]